MLRLSILLCALVFSFGAVAPLSALDPTLPVTAVVSPVDASYHNSLASLAGTAADDVSVSAVELKIVRDADGYFWDGADFVAGETWNAAALAAPNWSYAALPAWVNGSTYTVISRAQDDALNYSETYSTAAFYFDTGISSSGVTVPADGSSPALFSGISGTAADAEFGIGQVWVKLIRASDNMYWNGSTHQWTVPEAWNLAAGTVTWSWPGPPQSALTVGGIYFAVAAAKDMAGNDQISELGASTFTYAGATRPPGCADAISVKSGGGGSYLYIQDALDAMSKDLAGNTCLVVANDGSYTEEVTVRGFTNNGYRLIIMRDPAGGSPQVSPPPGANAVFRIMNDSVTVAGFDAIPGAAIPYGVYASSDNVILSSVTVVSAGSINTAGIRLAGRSEVSDSAVVTEASHGIQLTGGLNLVARTSVGNNAAAYAALYLNGSSSNTVTNSGFSNLGGDAVQLLNGSNFNLVDLSTITTDSADIAFHADNSDQNTLTRSYVASPSGYGVFLGFGADNNNVSSSTILSNEAAHFAVKLQSVSYNSLSHNVISNPAGVALTLVFSSNTAVEHSTVTSAAWAYQAVFIDASYQSAVQNSVISGANALFTRDSTGTLVAYSVLTATNTMGDGLRADSSRDITSVGNTITAPGTGLLLNPGNGGIITLASNTVGGGLYGFSFSSPAAGSSLFVSSLTFHSMGAGSAGIKFYGGQIVSTFTAVAFDQAAGINVDGALLSPGSRIIMQNYAGPRAGQLFENDPAGFVDWSGADITAPTAAVLGPAHLSYHTLLAGVNGTAADNIAVGSVTVSILNNATGLYWDGSVWGAAHAWLDAAIWPSSWTYVNVPAWVNGSSYTIAARAIDNSYNWSVAYSTAVFTYDVASPVAAITAPATGTYAAFTAVTGTAFDNVAVASVTVAVLRESDGQYWNGSAWAAGPLWNASTGTAVWNYNGITGAALSSGNTYLFTLRAYDLAGNVSNTALGVSTFTYVVPPGDLVPPTAAVLQPVHLSVLKTLAELSGTAADNVLVGSVTVAITNLENGQYWNGSAWAAPHVWLDASLWPSSWTYTAVPAWVESSSYVVTARAMDNAYNWSTAYSTAVFTYDLTPPSAGITAPVTGTYSSFVQLTGTAADARGVAQVQVSVLRESDGQYWNGAAWAAGLAWNAAAGTTLWNYTGITEAALQNGTTYLFNARAYDTAGNISNPVPAVSSFTYVLPPGGALSPGIFSGIGVSSLTVNWSTTHSTAAVYQVRLSSWAAEAPFLFSASTHTTSLKFSGLTPNTSYYGFVSTIPGAGFMASGFGVTLASAPAWVDFSSVAFTSATLVWSGGANPAWTVYEFELSTSSNFSAFTSSGSGTGTSAIFTGLTSWTQYYGRARAVNVAGFKSAYTEGFSSTLTQPLLPTGQVTGLGGAAQSASSITWTWSSGTVVDADLFSFYSGASVFLGTAPFGVTGTYGQTGLAPNAPYQLRVRGRNALGEGPLFSSPIVFTFAAAPVSASFSGIGYSSASLTWPAGLNPAGTVYEYELSDVANFASFVSSGSGTAAGTVFTGLAQGATYYARVRALNDVAVPTAYVSPAGPAITAVLLPGGLVSGLAGAAQGVSSVVWTWNLGAVTAADNFKLYSGPGVYIGTAALSASVTYTQAGFGPNTPHLLRVAGANSRGEGPLAASATVYTLAAAPADPAPAQVALTSASLTLGLGANAAGTVLQLWRSDDNTSFSSVYEGAAPAYADAALAECTQYYYKARARNGAGLYSGFGNTVSFGTLASTPSAAGGFSAEPLEGARIALAWEPSPSLNAARYLIYYDNATGTVDYGVPFTVLSSTAASWTTPALTAGSAYKFAIRTAGGCGTEDKNTSLTASAQAVGVLSGVRAAIKVPQTGKKVKGNSVTIVAEIVLGQPSQIAQVRFQYSPAGAGAWADIAAANVNHSNPDTEAPYLLQWNADAITPGAYDLRAVATDIYGVPDAAPSSVSIVIDPVDFDTSESVSAGEQKKEQKINNTVTSTVQASDDATALLTKVVIPSGAVTDSTVAVTVVSNPAAIPAAPEGTSQLNLSVKINLSNGQSQLSAGKTAAITFNYQDDDNNGIVDGTLASVDRLKVYAAADSGGAWSQLATSVDKVNKTVSGVTPHFSFFSVFASPAGGLGAIKLYPVPWQPGSGGRFDAAGVTFSGLPASARIKIFTLSGELVRLLEVNSLDAGIKVWDGRNSEGHKAASGIYIASVKSGSDERTIKVAVER
jgi:hypothetical protein